MAKEVPALLRAAIGNNATDPTQEPQNRIFGRLAQMRLEFAEGQSARCCRKKYPIASTRTSAALVHD